MSEHHIMWGEREEWKARALKAEADAKGWEEMHDKAAKSRDENLAARLKAEAALRAVTETVHSAELPGVAKLIAIDLIVRAALPLEPTP